MASPIFLALGALAYILLTRACLRMPVGGLKSAAFCLLNLAGVFALFFHWGDWSSHEGWEGGGRAFTLFFVAYVYLAFIQYFLLRLFVRRSCRSGLLPWVAFGGPIVFLIAVKYLPEALAVPVERALTVTGSPLPTLAPFFIGISYLAFRSSQLVLEVRNEVVAMPRLGEYLGFCFFAPTMLVGPISPYSLHSRSYAQPDEHETPWGTSLYRLVVGASKYYVLGALVDTLTLRNLFQDGMAHGRLEFVIGTVAYYLYLYCNFSGLCDMAIGVAGLVGIKVHENFEEPLTARNIKDFWNRWHITLSTYMRDIVFSPLSRLLIARAGPRSVNHAIAVAIFVVFLLIGIWHGTGINYTIYGAIHASGMVIHHYYTLFLKRRLGKEGFRAYNENRWIRRSATAITFAFNCVSLLFFAYSLPELSALFSRVQ